MSHDPDHRSFGRRHFIGLAAVAGAGLAATTWHALGIRETPDARWSDARTWGGARPDANTLARVSQPILVDEDATVAGIEIEPGGELVYDPDRRITIRTSQKVIVRGVLRMRPATPRLIHRLVFVNVDEGAFVGGGMDPIDSDVGLWVVDRGRLDIRGSRKTAWTRAATDVEAGAQQIRLERDPLGWRDGDEVVLTPTRPGSYNGFHEAKVRAIDGETIRLSGGPPSGHPRVPVGPGLGTEVLNLTRNVSIEGTPSGRSHIFVRSQKHQTIKNAVIRHMGPRQSGDFVAGRYGLHFHMNGRDSRGSVVEGVVIRDCGSHAFVAHNSHGVRFSSCISYDTWEEPYWWDPRTTDHPAPPDNFTNGVIYEQCVAALARRENPTAGDRLSGFWLGTSTAKNSDRCIGCVAVGIQGERFTSGFHWPEANFGVWVMEDCVAHNNAKDGIFTWQNTAVLHVIDRFIGYHNGKAGIEHGAYVNRYLYRDSLLYGNGVAGVIEHARSPDDGSPMGYERITVDGAGITPVAFSEDEVSFPDSPPVVVCSPTIRGVGREYDDGRVGSRTFDVRADC